GLVGIKPTVGLTSRAGVVPISRTQGTVGPMCRSVADAAAVLGALTGVDPRDAAATDSDGLSYTDYTQFLDPNGLEGARIGVARELFFFSPETAAVTEVAIEALASAGAEVIDPVSFPSFAEFAVSPSEFEVLLWECKTDITLYLEAAPQDHRERWPISWPFNEANADSELAFFGQEIFELAQARGELTDPVYLAWLEESRRTSRTEGLDAVLDGEGLDAILAPTGTSVPLCVTIDGVLSRVGPDACS
ncbi:MAG: amidase family protein, partial [Acidimicrobiia bacterium]|nr:amidase family protein [Acidimicrobiia bacterium]